MKQAMDGHPSTKTLRAGDIEAHVVWFDSMGAKCSSVLVETPEVRILIDPGAAAMQPSFPLPTVEKAYYRSRAFEGISRAAEKADAVIISHYHYDHHTPLSRRVIDAVALYSGKTLWAKDPNRYINYSQWLRSRVFYEELCRSFGNIPLKRVERRPEQTDYPDPMDSIPSARDKEYGSYRKRKLELLEKGRKWFEKLSKKVWAARPWISELKFGGLDVKFADGNELRMGGTRINFSPPLFHGIEFDRVGWVFATTIEHGGKKFLHSSDIQGPMIEDYADRIIRENPDILILDGPPTYMLGYMLNRINLNRAVQNLCNIIRETKTNIIIYDHHLPRDRLFKERVKEVYRVGEEEGKRVLTAAEYLGDEPMVLKHSPKSGEILSRYAKSRHL
ncbi:MAG: MBL fold metallo-hydrolase [Candidatus Bathyarchaeia archaeon]